MTPSGMRELLIAGSRLVEPLFIFIPTTLETRKGDAMLVEAVRGVIIALLP